MPADSAFFDTNILVYAFAVGEPRRERALGLLLAGGTIGVQTLNEFVNVYTRKAKKPWAEVIGWLDTIQQLCLPAVPLTFALHRTGLRIAEAYRYRLYDSLMLAAALEASCTIFYSEDMQDGQAIGDLTIRNPFV
jgi:predicted nucleic acid-binding protein